MTPNKINWLYTEAAMSDMVRRGNDYQRALVQMLADGNPECIEFVGSVLRRYKVGVAKRGSTILWRIDHNGEVQVGKSVVLSMHDGSLVQDETGDMAEALMKAGRLDAGFVPKPCLFGQHLLFGNRKPAFVVGDELQALYLACLDTQGHGIWLAGDDSDLQDDMSAVFAGRPVTLYGFGEEVQGKFKGADASFEKRLIIDVPPYQDVLFQRFHRNQRKAEEVREKVDEITETGNAHERLMKESEGYRRLVERLGLVLIKN